MLTAAQIWQLAQGLESILALVLVASISALTWLGLAWIKQRADYQRALNEGRARDTAQYEAETDRLTRQAEQMQKARELELFADLTKLGMRWQDALAAEASAPHPLKTSARIASTPEKDGQRAA